MMINDFQFFSFSFISVDVHILLNIDIFDFSKHFRELVFLYQWTFATTSLSIILGTMHSDLEFIIDRLVDFQIVVLVLNSFHIDHHFILWTMQP